MKVYTIITPNYLPFFEQYFRKTLDNIDDKIDLIVHFLTDEQGGDFGTDNFHRINYLKLKYLQEKVNENKDSVIMFCDADIIFLKKFQSEVLELIENYDMLFQDDFISKNGVKSEQYNTGVWVIKCNENNIRFFDEILLNLSWELFLKNKYNDQDYVNDQLKFQGKIKTNKLPLTYSAIHHFKFGKIDKLPENSKLLHLTCIQTVAGKIKFIEENFKSIGIII